MDHQNRSWPGLLSETGRLVRGRGERSEPAKVLGDQGGYFSGVRRSVGLKRRCDHSGIAQGASLGSSRTRPTKRRLKVPQHIESVTARNSKVAANIRNF